jgi:choline-sulfatase
MNDRGLPRLVRRAFSFSHALAPMSSARLLAPFALIALCACSPAGQRPTPERPSVLLIVVDTLRADRLTAYGGTHGLSPRLDDLARQGVRFENAFSHAPWTLPAFASLLVSQPPQEHGAGGQVGDFRALPAGIPTLPGRFRDAGYATGAVVNVDFLARPFGVTRDFESLDARAYGDNEQLRAAGATTDAALAWIREHRGAAFFLMVHYFDPHAEYRPPQPFRRRFAAPEDREDERFRFGTRHQVVERRAGKLDLRPTEVERAERLYDGEVAYVDQEIGRLLDGVSELALDSTTLVAFTADHGEEFLDHGDWEHGHTLYDELLRIPLILRQSGRLAPRQFADTVGHVDLAPTLLALCSLPPCPSFQGRDLSPVVLGLSGAQLPPAVLLGWGNFWGQPLASLREGELQLILKPDGRSELYRWTVDPLEHHDLALSEIETADRLRRTLERVQREASASGRGPGPRVTLSPDEVRRLSAVGYAGDPGTRKD